MAYYHSFGSTVSIDIGTDRLGDAVAELIKVHLAYAETAEHQHYQSLQVATGMTLYEALAKAEWLMKFPQLAIWCEQVAQLDTPNAKRWHVGIYAQKQPLSYVLQPLDRIEVYRSLSADPMSQRKSKVSAKKQA